MTDQPRKPWRVTLTQGGTQVAELDHTSEAQAIRHVRKALVSSADTARVMQWEDGRWIHFGTVHTEDL